MITAKTNIMLNCVHDTSTFFHSATPKATDLAYKKILA